MSQIDIDSSLLVGVVALQRDMIDQAQFAEACALWALDLKRPLVEVLTGRGWLTEEDRRDVERDVRRKLKKHRGDVRATLGAVAGADARDAIRAVDRAEVRQSLSGLPPASGHILVETLVPPGPQDDGSRYRLTRIHAEGGLGRVWLARDGELNREVALKEIKPDVAGNPETWRRFLKEAQITGQLEHPGIVPVHELSRRKEDNQPFYVMRFVRGRTLREAIAEHHRGRAGRAVDRLELGRLLDALIKVCDAVGYAHARGIVHRDLKPENVVIGGFGEVIVLDWGLAKMVDQPEAGEGPRADAAPEITISAEAGSSQTQGTVGTPAYMAPEQVEARHDQVDARTDVYALGGILFEILTGHPPADGTSTAEVYQKILRGIPGARTLDPTVEKALEAVASKALAVDRPGRYARAADLAEDVRRWMVGEPVSAYPEPWPARLARWGRRNRAWVQAGLAALVVVAVVASAAAFLIDQSRRATDFALKSETNAKARALAEQGRAMVNFRRARGAVNDYLALVNADGDLARLPALRPLREKLLRKAMGYYQEFLGEHREDPAVRQEAAEAFERIAEIQTQIGTRAEALAAYRGELELRRKIAEDRPDDADNLHMIGQNHTNCGTLLFESSEPAGAIAALEEGRKVFDRLIALDPVFAGYRVDLGINLNQTAIYRSMTGQLAESIATFIRAREAWQEATPLAATPKARAAIEELIAGSYNNSAMMLVRAGKDAEALPDYEKSLELKRKLAAEFPEEPKHRDALARTYMNLGSYHFKRDGDKDGLGLKYSEQARDLFEALVREDERSISYRRNYSSICQNLGMLHSGLGHAEEASRNLALALESKRRLVAQDRENAGFQHDLAQSLTASGAHDLKLGRVAEARKAFEECRSILETLVAGNPKNERYEGFLKFTKEQIQGLDRPRPESAEKPDPAPKG